MNIINISTIQDPAIMKIKVLEEAHKRKCSEDDIWELINNFRRTHEGKRSNAPGNIGDTLNKILSRITVTKKSAKDVLFDELVSLNIEFSANAEIGKYDVDFIIDNLIIDIDKDDFKRQLYLIKRGYTVMNFKANEIYRDVVGCVNKIKRLL